MTDTNTTAEIRVGDFFVESWGYEQTNIDFYKVVAVTAKSIKIQHWTTRTAGDPYAPQVDVVPGDGPVTGGRDADGYYHDDMVAPIITKRVKTYADRPFVKMTSYSNAYLWDGAAESKTGQGWGH